MTIDTKRLDLTDSEWMRLIDGDREDSALPICCANVSELRDTLIAAARHSGHVEPLFLVTRLRQRLTWVLDTHELTDPVFQKVLDTFGWTVEELTAISHETQRDEL